MYCEVPFENIIQPFLNQIKKNKQICSRLRLYRDITVAARSQVMLVNNQGHKCKFKILAVESWDSVLITLNVINEFLFLTS